MVRRTGYILLAAAAGAIVTTACASADWATYRNNHRRTGMQPNGGSLADPAAVRRLAVSHSFPSGSQGEGGSFRGSPVVANGLVFVGSTSGYFYALDAATLAKVWQYPLPGQKALLGSCDQGGNGSFGRYGIQSSATLGMVLKGQEAVVFGAPDPGAEGGLGSARLFALNPATGKPIKPIWISDVVAHVDACNPGAGGNERHERIAYSSPLFLLDTSGKSLGRFYVGIHDAADDPIQKGKIAVVDTDGHLVPFSYVSAGAPNDRAARGGGVWNSPATDGTNILFTTGNTRDPPCKWPYQGCAPAVLTMV
jgi:outer membrane protein assembly factor BamB